MQTIALPKAPAIRQSVPNIPRAPQQILAPAQPPNSSVALHYLEHSPIRVRGPMTGREYDFSGSQPVQAVDSRDAPALLRTRFFRSS
jgi:hypothetical protein